MRTRLLPICAVTAVVAVLLATPAHASGGTTYTWVGNTQIATADDHSWTDDRNWDPQGVPGDGDSVVIEQPAPLCFAHVDNVPTVSLVNFTLMENPLLCTVSISGGAITVAGLFQWNGGELATPTTVAASGTALVSGSNQRLNTLAATLDVFSTITLTGVENDGLLRIVPPQELHIEPGAALVSAGPNAIDGASCCTNPAKIRNEGDLAVNGSTLSVSTVELDQLGSIDATLDGKLDTTAGVVTTGASTDYSGNGSWVIEQGMDAHVSGAMRIGPGFVVDYGGLTSTFSSTLAGAATLSGAGTFSWTGGVIEASLTFAHGLTVAVSGAHAGGAGRVLKGTDTSGGPPVAVTQTNHGTFSVDDGATITTAASAHLVNAADGVMTFAPGTGMSALGCCVSPDRLVNSGTVSVLPSSGAKVAFAFVSYRSTGVTAIPAGRTLALTDAPDAVSSGRLTGGGVLSIAGPTALSGTVALGGHTSVLVTPGGSLDGNGTLTGSGSLNWTGGALSGRPALSPGDGITASGSDSKTVANVGGGSTPSVVRFTTPTAIAAGTSQHHDIFELRSSRLVLAAPTTVGRFTEFDDGVLENDSALSLHTATVAIRNYTQTATGSLLVDVANGAHGGVNSIGTVSLRGTVKVHNTVRPSTGSSIILVRAQALTGAPACVATSGTGASSGHWAATHTATQVVLHWRSGAHTHC